ncbi:TetR family transcriptional regulator C-terminal domain-containing protein [Streptomyces rubrogriseus]|uniref:TetR family transcriptional regulator C-terminal domain-containing protein n=1 Tax=Streptomyces rubrogriseus TaxID=194673 RepID=UPI001943BB80
MVQPARDLPPGIGRLRRLCTGWLAYSRDRVFPGSCFFYSATAEYDAREGKVHDMLAGARTNWLAYVEQTALEARQAGEIAEGTDVSQLAFELVALLEMANAESVLHTKALATACTRNSSKPAAGSGRRPVRPARRPDDPGGYRRTH